MGSGQASFIFHVHSVVTGLEYDFIKVRLKAYGVERRVE